MSDTRWGRRRKTAAAERQARALFQNARTDEVLRRLDLSINRRLDGLLQGDYRGLIPGHGSEPGESRPYQSGDDVRRIDWNVTARMQRTHIRETIAERELETWALIDLSASVDFGTARFEKRDLAIAGLAAVGFVSQRTGNRFGLIVADGRGVEVIPARTGRTHLMAPLHSLVDRPRSPEGTGAVDLGAAISRLSMPGHRRGLAVIVSDFMGTNNWAPALRVVGTRHETLAIEVLDPRELELPPVGLIELVDPETGRRRQVQTSSAKFRERYATAAAAQESQIAATIRGAGADHLVLRTDRDWLHDVVQFVSLRRERAGGLSMRPQRS